MRVALIHDWLNGMRGGEKVLEQLCLLYPSATIHTLMFRSDRISDAIKRLPIKTSFIQSLPFAQNKYRWFLPLFPAAIERFDLSRFDLVVSSSHCCALGVVAPAHVPHVCFCYTPMRYAWEHFDLYFPPERFGFVFRKAISWTMARLRRWDRGAAQRVTRFVAQSRCAADRILRHYGRESVVVNPPADVDFFTPTDGPRADYFLVVSALSPYKRIDVAVRAFNELGLPLVVIGDGPELTRIERLAGPSVKVLGWQSDESVRAHYRAARALVFPGEEDFGLTPIEAAACGTPTIALGVAGVLETVDEGVSGIFFSDPTVDGLKEAIRSFDGLSFDRAAIRAQAMKFSPARFRDSFKAVVDEVLASASTSVKGLCLFLWSQLSTFNLPTFN